MIEIVLWAIKHDVELLSVQDPEILAGGDLALLLGAIGGMRNHQDSQRKGKSVKDGLRRRVTERRQFVGGRRPYGYQWATVLDSHGKPLIKDGRVVKRLEIDRAEAVIVRRIFAEYLAGRAQNATARALNQDGVPTLTPSGSWYATTVAGMLKSPLFIGKVMLGGEEFPGEPEPIIDPDTWKAARELREGRQAHGRPRGRRTAGRHALTEGLLRCTCGAPMSPVTKRDGRAANGQGYETYCCVKRLHHGPDVCSQPPIRRERIDESVFDYFERVALDEDATRKAFMDDAARRRAASDASAQQAEAELTRADARLAKITRGWQDEVIDDEEFARQREEVLPQQAAARAQLEQHARRRKQVEEAVAAFDVDREVAKELTRLRKQIAGQVHDGSHGGLDGFRATLRRIFIGFELATADTFYGSGAFEGQVWAQKDAENLLAGDGWWLIPHVQPHAVNLEGLESSGFPAIHRAALALSDNLCARLADW